jgi:hypothetical protein
MREEGHSKNKRPFDDANGAHWKQEGQVIHRLIFGKVCLRISVEAEAVCNDFLQYHESHVH